VPVLVANSESGHLGTYYQKQGGKMGKVAVAFLKWRFRGDQEAKKLFCDATADSQFIKWGFDIRSKNGMC
jgi:hypothetical protein